MPPSAIRESWKEPEERARARRPAQWRQTVVAANTRIGTSRLRVLSIDLPNTTERPAHGGSVLTGPGREPELCGSRHSAGQNAQDRWNVAPYNITRRKYAGTVIFRRAAPYRLPPVST